MIVYGYVIDTKYTNSGEFYIQVRIPNIHGAMNEETYDGQKIRNFTSQKDLPWYPSLLLPYRPNYGAIVALASTNEKKAEFLVIGLTGGYYKPALG